MTMTNRGMWRTASSGTTYPRGSFDDHIDLVSGGPVDHDGFGFVDNNSGMQERQEQYLQETRNASICNGSPPYTDAVSVYEGVLYGDEVHDAGMSDLPSPGFIGQASSYSNGENDSMDMEDAAYLFPPGQLNDQSLRGLSFEAPQDDVDEVVSASPPSTTDTTLNNHGSAG
ncbi:hypothetical protein BR93DRAFT_927024 [Coniochaeta sp. PMI_546]|nr:hypothetical protein BR93DRAFT_927024 [Coniochaeta sp. PMI_546]